MIILGISIGYDKGAVLIKNGKVIVGITEERITRVPRDGAFTTRLPIASIKYCMNYANLSYDDIDLYVWSAVDDSHDYAHNIAELTDAPTSNIKYIPHHLAHAYAAYSSSPNEDTFILVSDNHGSIIRPNGNAHKWFNSMGYEMLDTSDQPFDWAESTSMYHFNKDGGRQIFKTWIQNSDELMRTNMASIYSRAARKLVFDRDNYIFNIEHLTQLAPYGDRVWEDLQPQVYDSLDGHHKLIYDEIDYHSDFQLRANVASIYQREHTRVVDNLISKVKSEMDSQNLVVIGSLFRNAKTMNVVQSNHSDLNIHIPSMIDDESISLGCALWGNWFVSSRNLKLKSPFLGNSYETEDVFNSFEELDHIFQGDVTKHYYIRKCDSKEELSDELVTLLLNNKVIGVFDGASEFGVTPLGGRSILVNPTHRIGLDYVTTKVKEQQWWLHHNSVILEEHLGDVVKSPILAKEYPLLSEVHGKWKSIVPTLINHRDSIRYTTSDGVTPLLNEVLLKFNRKTGIPMLANIPFSVPLEPIVETPYEALRCMYTLKLSAISIGNILIIKK